VHALEALPRLANNSVTPDVARRRAAIPVTASKRFSFTVPADHPSLPGHFPGQPVVPGAVMLAELAHGAAQALGAGTRVSGFPAVKFLSPLRPGQQAEVTLTEKTPGHAAFEIRHEGRRVASGSLRHSNR
jgi:3-hydroxymyristoyl/3-hydroxydecanoyl-(acyl carrier protein) dehydratase